MIFKKIINKIIYGGSSRVSPLELGLVRSVQNALEPRQSLVIDDQIKMVGIIQRGQDNRMITFYFDREDNLPLLDDLSANLCLAKIDYRIGKDKFMTKLFIHRGRISSLETKKKLTCENLQKPPEDPITTLVIKAEEGLGSSFDRIEHGENG